MGLAIGSQGSNITAARKIEGIEDIHLDEGHGEASFCTFKVSPTIPKFKLTFSL